MVAQTVCQAQIQFFNLINGLEQFEDEKLYVEWQNKQNTQRAQCTMSQFNENFFSSVFSHNMEDVSSL